MKKTTDPTLYLQSLKVWLTKIQPWMRGEDIDDAPRDHGSKSAIRRNRSTMLKVTRDSLMFHGPFATVTLHPSGTLSTDKDHRWVAHVTHCANPAHAYYTDLSKAVNDWAGSVWATAIRGVIG